MPDTIITNTIADEHAPASSGRTLPLVEPATGRTIAHVADSDADDVDRAVAAARDAFPAWRDLGAAERSRLLLRLASLIERDLEPLAAAESADTGKPITTARTVDIPRAALNFRFFATAILHTRSDLHPMDTPPGADTALNYTLRDPRGVAGLIAPWNLPLYLLTWKIAPALATGNTAVAKPSELTPSTASMLARLALEAGIPPGVLNIIHGRGDTAGRAIVQHPDVPAVSFTGSTRVGRWIGATCGEMLKRCSLELGGKNPFVVFDDADPALASAHAARAAFSNQGQICLCGSRILVHERARDDFLERFLEHARGITPADPLEDDTRHGAQISHEHTERIHAFVTSAIDDGAALALGGDRVPPDRLPERCRGGAFYQPTVLLDPPNTCDAVQQEVFGPVVTVQTFRDDDHAVELANSTPYGLAASLWTRDLDRAHLAAARIRAGVTWINCWMLRDLRTPFGGVGQSGVGREGGDEALRFFTEPRNICVALRGQPREQP